MHQLVAPAMPLEADFEFDISHELSILYRLADQPQRSRRRLPPAWTSVAAITLALGWGGAAYAARSSYTVLQGETLYQIANRHLGSGTRWVEIAALNNIKDPAKVRAGQAIMLPDRRERVAVAAPRNETSRAARSTTSMSAAERRGARSVRSVRSVHSVRSVRTVRSGPMVRSVRLARGVGQTHEGVPIVPAGDVVLELPARKVEVRPAVRTQFSRPVAAERVRPKQADEIVSPLPAPPAKDPASPWRAVDGAAFLIGALGVTGLLSRTRSRASRRNPQAQWQIAALELSRQMAAASQAEEASPPPEFWGPLQGADLGRLAVTAPAR